MLPFSEQMKRWAAIAGRPLNSFEQMTIARPFKYDPYDKAWVRMVKPIYSGDPFGVIEMALTPPHAAPNGWSFITPMACRRTNKSMANTDKFHSNLPDDVFQQLVVHVGQEQAVFMTHNDLWPLMDMKQFKRNEALGYVPFHLFRLKGTEGLPEEHI